MTGVILAIVLCLSVAVRAEFPDDPKPCKYGDGDCIVKLVNNMFEKRSSRADPSLNLEQLEPLKVDTMTISQGEEKSPVAINLKFTNNLLYGIKDIRLTKVKGFDKDLTAVHEIKAVTKVFSMIGPYTINGKVLILPISGSGQSNMTLVNMKAIIRFSGKALEKNGETYLDVDDLKLSIKPESVHFYFGNLFNGDKALGDNMNVFLNENSQAIYQETSPAIEKAFGEKFMKIVKDLFSKHPYAKFYAQE